MWTLGSFVAIWGQHIIAIGATVLFTVSGYFIGRYVEGRKAARYFKTYADELSKDNLRKAQVAEHEALAKVKLTEKDIVAITTKLKAAKIMTAKALECLS